MAAIVTAPSPTDLSFQIGKLEKRYSRERQARIRAEEIAEQGLRDLFEKQRELELLQKIAECANSTDEIDAAFQFCIKAVRNHCGAAFGDVFWLPDRTAGLLRPTSIWDADASPQLQHFRESGRDLTFAAGIGLPGRVLSSGRPVWVRDVTDELGFARVKAARQAGLKAGFAFPVLVGTEVVAVLELFLLTITEPNEALLAVLQQIGVQLGRVVERSRAQATLVYDASHDALTGLPNRRALLSRMETEFNSKRRFKLLLIDLDRFKNVNDTFGHPFGDLLLVQAADRLRSSLGDRGYLARLGGDELAALVEGDLDNALSVSQKMIDCFTDPFELGRATVGIGCSIGLSCTDDALSVMEMMQQSDIALYEAKRNGRGQASCYRAGMLEAAADQHRLENDLRLALARNELHLAYQPVMTLRDEQIIGYEALIRWEHPTRGPVPPSLFIPLAEQSELIIAIGSWVLAEACREAAQWTDGCHVAVNVSSVQLCSSLLLQHVEEALALSGLPAERLELEVTETALIASGAEVINVLTDIRRLGVKIAMDDFGTGYSSLSHLHTLVFDRIKIDRSFVVSAASNRASMAVLKGVVQIGRDLGVATLAEGVETIEQRDLLHAIGCDVIQGYLIGKPERRKTSRSLDPIAGNRR